MRVFETQSMFDRENDEWVETYLIDNVEVEAEDYFEEMENETFDEEDDEDCCECLDCITDKYVDMLQEACCPDCTKQILISFLSEVLNKIEFDED